MGRLTDHDRKFGPLTVARAGWNPWRVVYSSGGDEDADVADNHLTVYAFGYVARLAMPNLLQPYRVKHIAHTWDAATVERMGRNWYYETFPREYGFSLHEGFLQLFLGRQTHSSESTQSWATHLPWTQWRHVRFSLYDEKGDHFWTQRDKRRDGLKRFEARREAEERCPSVSFELEDFDGERIEVKTQIHEREWRFGEGWFKWLSLFRRPKVVRSLDLAFSAEVGPEKGSWKGGLIGTSINMLPGELHEAAFRRYCEQEHRSKYQTYRVKFSAAP